MLITTTRARTARVAATKTAMWITTAKVAAVNVTDSSIAVTVEVVLL